jgi:hypothetical protein
MAPESAARTLFLLNIFVHVLPMLPILYVLVRLNGDYRRRSSDREHFNAACDRSTMREEAMHPWVHETSAGDWMRQLVFTLHCSV